MVVSMFSSRGDAGPMIPYSDFRAKVAEGTVDAVEIGEDRIDGKMKNGDSFSTVLVPGDITLTQLLQENNVKRSEEHTSELQSLMRISYAVFCLKKKKNQ